MAAMMLDFRCGEVVVWLGKNEKFDGVQNGVVIDEK